MSLRARVTAVWLLVVAAAVVFVSTRLRVDADYSAFLPVATSTEQRFLVSELKEGSASRLLLIEVSGDAPERLAGTSRTLAQHLAADSRFRYVNNGDSEWGMRDFEALRANRYLLSDAGSAGKFGAQALHAALAARVRALASGSGIVDKALLPEDPTGETLHLAARLAPAAQPRQQFGVWFDVSGTRAVLVAQTRAPGSDLDGQAQALAGLEQAFASASANTHARLRYSSPGAMAAQSRTLIADDASRLGLVSTALVLAILGFVYRSLTVVALCAIPALTGLLVGVAAVDVAFGAVHAITLGFGATLLGEAVDYPGYLLTQMQRDETARATLARLARTLAMAVLTTAAASVALLLAGFPGLAQLGVLTMVGVLGAGAVTAWVLPHWVPAGWRPAPIASSLAHWRLPQSPRASAAIAIALAATLLALATRHVVWDDDLANMNPLPSELKQRDRELRATLGAPEVRYMLLVDAPTQQVALRNAEQLRPVLERAVAARVVGGFELVSDYLPSQSTQQQRRTALPEPDRLRANFAEALSGLPLRIEAFAPFFDAVARAKAAPPISAADLAGTALGLKVEALLRTDAGRWYVVVPLAAVADPAQAQAYLAGAQMPDVRWIDLQATSRAMMAGFRARALQAFGVGALLIVIVLAVGLRSVAIALRIALAPALGVVATAAGIVALGSALTVFHLVALMLVAGIGTNYALFLARGAAAGGTPGTMLRSLAVVAGTTLCAFGTLASSRIPVLHAIGSTVALGVVLSLAFSVLMPALNRQSHA